MKKYATLLIQHIEVIYPMIQRNETIQQGFLAFHHDEILATGVGEGSAFIDKDTRIVEGRGHIAIPAFCDISLEVPMQSFYAKKEASFANQLQTCIENTNILMRHGTLIGNQQRLFYKQEEAIVKCFTSSLMFDMQNQNTQVQPIIYPFDKAEIQTGKPFYISCGYPKHACLDQWLCAKVFYQNHDVDAYDVIAACTIHPANALQLHRYGKLQVGCIGNVLLLEGNCIESVLNRLCGDEHIQVIKEGIRIYPKMLR